MPGAAACTNQPPGNSTSTDANGLAMTSARSIPDGEKQKSDLTRPNLLVIFFNLLRAFVSHPTSNSDHRLPPPPIAQSTNSTLFRPVIFFPILSRRRKLVAAVLTLAFICLVASTLSRYYITGGRRQRCIGQCITVRSDTKHVTQRDV